MNRKNIQKLFILLVFVTISVIFFLFCKDFFIPLIQYRKGNYQPEVEALISQNVKKGMLFIVILQSLQFIGVFFPAEIVHVLSSISVNWYTSLGLLLLGTFIGSTLIYIFVRLFKFDVKLFDNLCNKIDDFTNRNRKGKKFPSLMYLLFLTPSIPFGAICYYAASKKVSYIRYLFNTLLGVLPSILFSLGIGYGVNELLGQGYSFVLLIVLFILAILIIYLVLFTIITKVFFHSEKGTPNSVWYNILFFCFRIIVKSKVNVTIDNSKLGDLKGPYILLSNHASFLDVYFLTNLVYPQRLSFIMNRYYFRFSFCKWFFNQIGAIPKKLFSPDVETIKLTLKSIKNGFPVLMCPEGRLSIDGTNYYITKETGKLLKMLKVPVVIANIHGAYISNPKWRAKRFKGNVHTEVKYVISKEDVANLSIEELNKIINENIAYNDFEYARENNYTYKSKNKMKDAESILYHCPKCHKDFVLHSNNNKLTCSSCGFEVEANENYSFKDNELNIKDFSSFYKLICEHERENIEQNSVNLHCDVTVEKFNFTNKNLSGKGYGSCTLTKDQFTFKGKIDEKDIEFNISNDYLRALAFSAGKEFECYYEDELYYFYPTENRNQCVKWALIVDELNKEEVE